MRYIIFLLILTSFLSCQPNLDIHGFWVGVDEEGDWNDQTISATADSIFIYDYFGMPLKSTYTITGSKIKFGTTYQLFSNERFTEGGEVEIEISDNTLYWKLSSNSAKYIRSRFDSYVEHYANSKGLKIDLPTSDLYSKPKFSSYTPVDLFIGYDSSHQIRFSIGEMITDSASDLKQWMNQESDSFHTTHVLRLFADKSTPNEYILLVRELMKSSSIHLIQNVTKPSTRRLINLRQNPFSNYFYGATTVVRIEPKIVEIAN